MDPYKILDNILNQYKRILKDNLLGFYVHGSLAMGCYTDNSDIDFLVVVEEPLSFTGQRELIQVLLQLEEVPPKGVEMSIILKKYAKHFIHPTPFELHYSPAHKEKYLNDESYICGGFEDPDLAAHMTITKHRGICLYGLAISELFGDIPEECYLASILSDIENAEEDILRDPVYSILNLCRVLYYLKEKAICSKLEGGTWGRETLPQLYTKLIEEALLVYKNGLPKMNASKEELVAFAEYMLKEVKIQRDTSFL
jgi:predicted nucleotidyltransferase